MLKTFKSSCKQNITPVSLDQYVPNVWFVMYHLLFVANVLYKNSESDEGA